MQHHLQKASTAGRDDPVLLPDNETEYAIHLFGLKAERHFNEGQLATMAFQRTKPAGSWRGATENQVDERFGLLATTEPQLQV
jgi:hypothetical protein